MANFADLWESGSNAASELKNDFNSRLDAAKQSWKQQTGKDLPITSGFRTTEQQANLYKNKDTNPYLVAKPGTSKHEKGEAADIPLSVPDSFLNQFGLHRPNYRGKVSPHVELKPDAQAQTTAQVVTTKPANQTSTSNFADLWESAPVGNEPKNAKQEQMPAKQDEDLTKPVTFNRNLARQGAKMREQGNKLQSFVQEVAKPLESISAQDWKDKSLAAPAIEYTAASIGIPGFTKDDKKIAEEKLVKKGKAFVEGVNQFIESPVETTKQALSALAENPGKFIGESVKSVIYDPEQIVIGGVAGKVAGDVVQSGVNATKKGANIIAETPIYQGLTNKAKSAVETMREGFDMYKQANAPKGGVSAGIPIGASVGAAQSGNKAIVAEAISRASPELSQALSKLNPDEINLRVLENHMDADSLPIPMKLSEGMATRDPKLFSDEMNSRAKNPQYANNYNELNKQLVENIDAIKENASPNVYGTNVVENGQSLINSYLDLDLARKADIDSKYLALRDAAGGQIPINGVKFADNAFAALRKNLKTEFLPAGIRSQLDAFKKGEPMTFEQFEAMRTNLASEMRKADRAGDGNAEFALSKVREALEDLPLVGETKELKVLADAARNAAKQRFDMLDSDKAYKAAVNGKVEPDDFINKFVINGKKNDIDTMVAHLGSNSQAREVMAAGIVNWLKSKANILNDGSGTFSQKGFNKALESVDPKILNIVGPEVNQQLKALGKTARNIQERPPGAYVNESNTFVSALGEKAANIAETGANYLLGGNIIPVGTMTRNAVANAKQSAQVKKSLKPAAGVQLKDIGKE
jgi:hypothetical protein